MGIASTQSVIKYHDLVVNTSDIPLRMFPVINAIGPDGKYETLLLCHYVTKNGPDYVVLGKFMPGYLPTSTDSTCLKWFHDLKKLLDIPNNGNGSYSEFLKQLKVVKTSAEMDRIMFTQEGYDLLSGKYFFLHEGTIQRTVEVETYDHNGQILFGMGFYPVNAEGKMTHLNLFDKWEKYDEGYFLNQKDLSNLLPGNLALLFAVLNKDRLFMYVKKNYTKGNYSHNIELNQLAPDDVAGYSLQLLDVVTDFQLEINHQKEQNSEKRGNRFGQ